MTVKINPDKAKVILKKIKDFLDESKPTVRSLASVISTLVSLFPTMAYGKLYYRNLDCIFL